MKRSTKMSLIVRLVHSQVEKDCATVSGRQGFSTKVPGSDNNPTIQAYYPS